MRSRFHLVLGLLGLALTIAAAGPASAGERASWLRYPAISPDGATVAFSYRGDLYRVPSEGGLATQLTVHQAHDTMPVWSPDGKWIAFASDRYGNLDVFVMPAAGGEATRLTFHSANDEPTSFTPDGRAVLFSSARLDSKDCVQFPVGAQPELYQVAVTGGMPRQVLTTPAMYATYDSAEKRLAYSDQKGYEMEWRKHDHSSFARDVWLWDASTNRHTRLTAFGADDRQPVWAPGEEALYFLSERGGSFNVWRMDLADPSHPVQITHHDTHPVRFLSVSRHGDLCYGFDGQIWVRPAGSSDSLELEVTVASGSHHNRLQWTDVARDITEFELSPDGKEIAFVARGEVFVTSVGHSATRRITDTPEQERSVSFSPDGRSLLYASERGGSWNLYRTDLTDDAEPSFFNATGLAEKPVLVSDQETFQPHFSPDGKEVAYLENRTTLKVLNLASGKTRTILPGDRNYSYRDGDQWYEWSPDGRWFLVEFMSPTRWSSEVGLVSATGDGEVSNLTKSGYEDLAPRWAMDGQVVVWLSDRDGDRMQAGWPDQLDVYGAFFTTKAWDRYHLTEAELEQVKAEEKKEKEKKETEDQAKAKGKKGEEAASAPKELKLPEPVDIQLEGLEDRMTRLSLQSADLADARLTPDGEKLLFLARYEKGYDLWSYDHRSQKVKLLAKLNADRADHIAVDGDGKKAYVLADRSLHAVDLDKGDAEPVKLEAKMELDPQAERAYLFEHAWRQTREKFYDTDMHGVDWDAERAAYAKFLPDIDDDWDLAELISEMQGELNASHTGCYYRPRHEDADETASLGFFPDPTWDGSGVRIAEVIAGGPLGKAGTKIRAGVVVSSIDGAAIPAGSNWYPLLNHKSDAPVRLGLLDPASGEHWQERVKPITDREQTRLLYERWVRSRRAEVERLSGGRLGYAHIRTMNDSRFREIFEDIFGKAVAKEGIVLDTRFNNGGNLDEALTIFLTGKVFARAVPRGRQVGVEPSNRWTKPSIVVMNEGNYSDAHCFPEAYKALAIGDTVGMPVPGTCTSVWWERLQNPDLRFGIPEVGYLDNHGKFLENQQLEPDHEVDNDPELEAAGRDQQLEEAVKVLLAALDAGKS